MRCHVKPIRNHVCTHAFCRVPLSPDAIAQLYARFMELKEKRRLPKSMTFD